jgi:hypothetical protein
MKFSVEELYFMYGQNDAFVAIQFDEQTTVRYLKRFFDGII